MEQQQQQHTTTKKPTTTTTTPTFIPVHTKLVYMGSRNIVSLFLNLGCR